MSIIWKYLDKRSAAVDALKDYSNMKFIISNTDDEIRAAFEKMSGVSSPQPDGMPHAHNPHAGEDRMVKGIEEIDVLRHGRSFPRMTAMCWKHFIVRITSTAAVRQMMSQTISASKGHLHTGGRTGRWRN